jgi:hypothetical protein
MVGLSSGANPMRYTYDGIRWYPSPSGNAIFYNGGDAFPTGVAWNGSIWVAVGNQDGSNHTATDVTIAYSSDGINWTPVTTDPFAGYHANGVAWNGSIWVAIGGDSNSSTNSIATSSNGINWTAHPGPFPGIDAYCIAWNGSIWVAGGGGQGDHIATSADGINWTPSTPGNAIIGTKCLTLAWNGTLWVAGGSGIVAPGDNGATLAYSYDGITWNPRTGTDPFSGATCTTVAWNGSLWLAGAETEGGNMIAYSLDGETWIGQDGGANGNGNDIFTQLGSCFSIAWNGTYWIAGGTSNLNTNTCLIVYSTDGKNWTPSTSGNSIFSSNCVGLASRRILPYIGLNIINDYTRAIARINNQPADTTVSLSTIGASIDASGNFFLGSYVGSATSIDIYGQATWSCDGVSPSRTTISLASTSTLTLASTNPGTGTLGDVVVAIVTDTSNSHMYRITGQVVLSGNYSVIIEQLM